MENEYVVKRQKELEAVIKEINRKLFPDDDGYPYDWLQMAEVRLTGELPIIGRSWTRAIGKIGPYFDTNFAHYKDGCFSRYAPKEFAILEISRDAEKIQDALKEIESIDEIEAAMGNHYPEGVLIHTSKKFRTAEVVRKIDTALRNKFPYYVSYLG